MNHFLKTVTEIFTSEFKERGSKFIGYLIPAKSEEEFDEQLQKLKTELWDASHHCYAYRIGASDTTEFSSDDGEPSGTAGLPILNQLRSNELVDVCAVVVRYFGGTKLGKSGLIEAYGEGAKQAIEASKLKTVIPCVWFEVSYEYSEENIIQKLRQDFQLHEKDSEYLENVTLTVAVPSELSGSFKKRLEDLAHLSISFKRLDSGYYFS
ncbi:MAG: YigZ family protein [Balneola sp.]